ncbi:MAG: PilZ domain-containing protein [Sedimentisphaerales bacterium]|nr:PilZ domain-containing protein [Sedimentisphaerales bacterium]
MNIPEIERLITEAICNRPKVTTAPLNLYLYDSKLFCGGRIVMPKDAKFVSYVPTNCLEKGFNEQEWKLIVQKINQIANNRYDDDNNTKEISNKKQLQHTRFNERRREQRLYYRRPMWYFQNLNKARHKGRMVDISSNGMAFTCSITSKSSLAARQTISTRLDVPLFCKDGSYDMVRFDREGQICRVEKLNNSTHRVALQFSQPLPFKPAEQGLPNSVIEQKLAALT